MELLIIDEWLLAALPEEHTLTLFEIIESRLKTTSTIFCSQTAPEGWYEKLGEALVADAILDRIIGSLACRNHYLIDGVVSMRERHGFGGRQMISSEVEDRIARYFFHRYLQEDVELEIVGKLLPFYLIDDDQKNEPSADEMVKLAIDIIDSQLEI